MFTKFGNVARALAQAGRAVTRSSFQRQTQHKEFDILIGILILNGMAAPLAALSTLRISFRPPSAHRLGGNLTYGEFGDRPRVLVTGASRGIGRKVARAAALFDVELILADVDGRSLAELASELSAHGMFCDCQSTASIEIFKAHYGQKFDSLHVLINAADEGHDRILSTIRMSSACLPLIRRTHGPRAIINLADSWPPMLQTPFRYAASPEATASYSAHLQRALKGSSVCVETILTSDDDDIDTILDMIEPKLRKILYEPSPLTRVAAHALEPPPLDVRHDAAASGLNEQIAALRKFQ